MERIIDRLDKYIKVMGLNDNILTIKANLSVGLIGKARKNGDLGKNSIEKILNVSPDLNRVWLLTGSGEMLIAPADVISERRFDYDPQGTSRRPAQPKNVNIIEPGDITAAYKALLDEKDRTIAAKDCTIASLTNQIADKDEIIRLLRLERTTAQSSADVSDAAAG